jgi:hypothetical protein
MTHAPDPKDSVYWKIVEDNLKVNIRYTYVLPAGGLVEAKGQVFRNQIDNAFGPEISARLDVRPIPEVDFERLPYTLDDVIIFTARSAKPLSAFMRKRDGKEVRWIRLEDEEAHGWLRQILSLLPTKT